MADFGAGHGYFTIPLARTVGGDGKVYALDIQKSVLDIVRAKAKIENLLNIEPVWANLDETGGSKLKDKFIDFVLIASIIFQAEKKENLFLEAYRILRDGGRLAVIEWEETPVGTFGPPSEFRIKKELVKQWSKTAGFSFELEFETGSHHYGLMFKK